VLVPGITDGGDDLMKLGAFIGELTNVEKLELLPYHRMGVYKWQQLNKTYPLEGVAEPTEREVERARQLIGLGRAQSAGSA